ncbi:FMN-binding negative transcriptional regulator [Shimia aestuarii]|uniref:Negative transcriptional regulator, PaiB family n=1 Tax=Shimia aestuarii TaxID=254406 RepID=A0A1I4K3G3_9RHOB|nr:FMN-binding negative transcriptional regulator [Shimia aestuarii]SFL73171.1 negative transcriptional regulator, PaiB family [Shimia aestuarii]
MHPNPAFRTIPSEDNLAFARERGFGILTTPGDAAPLISHVPFVLDPDGTHADLHLVRSNPMVRAVSGPTPARIAISGPDSYISPDWYNLPDQVPTWNYVAVHLTGTLSPLPDDQLPGLLDELSLQFEAHLLPKPPWTRDKMTPGAFERMLRMIRPFRLTIDDVAGTWKLGQNKPAPARHAAADQLGAYGVGTETRVLAGLMRSPVANPDQQEG